METKKIKTEDMPFEQFKLLGLEKKKFFPYLKAF